MAGFQDIYGQEAMKEHLQNAIRLGKVSHAYIINGEKELRQGVHRQDFCQDSSV